MQVNWRKNDMNALLYIQNDTAIQLESTYHVTRMRALDWSQVQNMMEQIEGAIGVHPLSLKGFQQRKAMQSGNTNQCAPY